MYVSCIISFPKQILTHNSKNTQILWWATRLTFNSSRVLRHMTRLLSLSGDTKLAKRTLNLYIQVVGKAYETSGNVGVSLGSEGQEEDTDTDSNWVDTLIFGVAMLYKPSCPSFSSLSPSPPSSEMDNLNEAHQIIEKAKTRLNKEDKRLVAKVLLAEGVYWMMLGVKGRFLCFSGIFKKKTNRVIQVKTLWLDQHISLNPTLSSSNPYGQIQRQTGITTSLFLTLSQEEQRHKDLPPRQITLPTTTSTKQSNTPV